MAYYERSEKPPATCYSHMLPDKGHDALLIPIIISLSPVAVKGAGPVRIW